MNDIAAALASLLGQDRVATDQATVEAHRLDYWVLAHLRAREGRLGPPPACVVQPHDTAEVAAAVRLCQQHGAAVVPYGGGSGVLGGAMPPPGAVVVDLRKMNRLLSVDETSLLAVVQAGMLGSDYERAVQARGYTSAHWPQSIERATMGGLVATRSAGQFSTRYGNIEDLCLGLEVVLPNGEPVRIPAFPRSATGPSLREIFLGSEGALGIVTEVTMRLFPLPERRALASFAFPTFAAGLEAIRRIVRVGWRPPVLRLYDAMETARTFSAWAPSGTHLLLVVSEGPSTLVDVELDAVTGLSEEGTVVGPAPVAHWLEHRNEVPSWDFFFERGLVVDTIEIAATWDRIAHLYHNVLAALQDVPGMLVASAHSSHSYGQGTNLYVTFALKPEDFSRAETSYLDAWSRVMEATLARGGTIAHHHGIGRLRVPWLARELGNAYPVLLALKRALDPANVMNPGALVVPPSP